MITTVKRKIPDQVVTVAVNTEYFVLGYKVTVDGKSQCLVKFTDYDLMDITDDSFDALIRSFQRS
jgi:hypothetical protein